MSKLLPVLFALFVATTPAFAQDKPLTFSLGGGVVFPLTDLKDEWDMGYNFNVGLTFNIKEKVGVLTDYTYFRMGGPDRAISLTATPVAGAITNGLIESNHQMHVGTVDLVYKMASSNSSVGGYALGGAGIYHRMVQLTSPSVGYTTFCDPYWYVCYPTLVSVDQILGDRSSNDFGINVGGGLTFGSETQFFVEARYHYVYGKKFTPDVVTGSSACADGCSTSGSYFPITFGFRF